MKLKILWAALLSIIFVVFLSYMLEWSHFALITDRIVIKHLCISFLFLLLANIARGLRFFTLDHMGNKLSHWIIINKIYNFATATLPGGVGEAVTAYLLKRVSLFNMLSAFRILILSRIMDLAAISGFLFFIAVLIDGNVYYRETSIWISGILLFFAIIAILPSTEDYVLQLTQKVSAKNRLIRLLHEKLGSLKEINAERVKGNSFWITLFQSLLVTVALAVSIHFVLLSFGTEFSLIQSFYCSGLLVIFQMVPIQGIAGIGTQPARWAIALKAAGYKSHDAVALGFVLHGTFYLFIALMGFSAILLWLAIHKTRIL